MQAAQLKVFLAKLKSEPLLQSQLTAEGADIVSTAKVASLFIDSNESTTEAVVELSDQEIKDQIFDALSKRNNPSISPIIIWASLLTVLLILIGVFLSLRYWLIFVSRRETPLYLNSAHSISIFFENYLI